MPNNKIIKKKLSESIKTKLLESSKPLYEMNDDEILEFIFGEDGAKYLKMLVCKIDRENDGES